MKGLLIFIKNPIYGKVKTRLAASIGKTRALKVYKKLIRHTREITEALNVQKIVYYAWHLDHNDEWDATHYGKKLQHPTEDLGLKMYDAFLENQHEQIIIIGSDCYELSQELLEEAFTNLDSNGAVLGEAVDGGYYLIGINKLKVKPNFESLLKDLFLNKKWSHERVAAEAQEAMRIHEIDVYKLPKLSDIDRIEDIEQNTAFTPLLSN